MPGYADEDLQALVALHLDQLWKDKNLTQEEQIHEEVRKLLAIREKLDLEIYLIHMGYTPDQVLPSPQTRSA